jgi:hypothetical protein
MVSAPGGSMMATSASATSTAASFLLQRLKAASLNSAAVSAVKTQLTASLDTAVGTTTAGVSFGVYFVQALI